MNNSINNPFQLISTTYSNTRSGPQIIVYGRDSLGNFIKYVISDFKPYLYVQPKEGHFEEIIAFLETFGEVENILDDFKFLPFGYQTQRSQVLKVFTKRPSDVPKIRDALLNDKRVSGIFDADILFASSRFLADNKLYGMGWVETDKNGNLKSIIKSGNSPLKYLAWDIEVLVPEKGAPISSNDPIILISAALNIGTQDNKPFSFVFVAKPGQRQDFPGYAIEYCNDERGLLLNFLALIREYNPDIIMGYNTSQFDFPYLAERLNINGISDAMGRDNSSAQVRSFGSKHEVRIVGRAVADLLELIKTNYSLINYKLSTVASTLLKHEKLDVKPSEMRALWLSDKSEDLQRFIEYSRRDSDLVLEMATSLKILDKYIAISKEAGCFLHDTLNSGQQVRIESMLLHEFVKEGRMFPLRKKSDNELENEDPNKDDTVKGAFVFESIPGLYENVDILDYKSLYPSCMRAYNLCVSTIINEDPIPHLWNILTPPNGAHYINHQTYHGIIPRILERLYNKRLEFKHLMKEAKTDSERDFYDANQYATKILLNSIYGFTGAPTSRFFDPRIANSVTAIGRETIQLTQKTAESLLPCKVIGGDTDSIFLELLEAITPEEGQKCATIIHDEMLKLLPPPMEIDFECFAKRALILAKKRYAMWIFEPSSDKFKDKVKIRGIETRRRDWCVLIGETMTTVLDMVLKEGRVEESRLYAMSIVNNLKNLHNINDNWNLAEKLILSKQISRNFEDYDVKMPHVEVCRKMEKRGETAFGLGDRVPYFAIPGALRHGISQYVDTPEFIKEHGGQIDIEWYMEKQLMPPLKRIFDALNINILTGKGIPKQCDIFKFNCNNVKYKQVTNVIELKNTGGIFAFK